MIGIIGYGIVGQAVSAGFDDYPKIISDPQFNNTSISDVVQAEPAAIFVCVPTPTDGSDYEIMKQVLDQLSEYKGLIVVKSTILPKYLESRDLVYNPEFLSRSTYLEDFVNPPMVIIGGQSHRRNQLVDLYSKHSRVCLDKLILTDIPTACLAKYTMNSFYATKITFMNQIYDVAQTMQVDWTDLTVILSQHPWMGTHHFQVPGPDGLRGFGGPCLPKDTRALADTYNLEFLDFVLELNNRYRKDLYDN